ncbi:Metalloenzyme, LuxS/M16 peptidase-like protein [Myxozyma melibiosi]|uniref:Metalloenzyme, LuxS/M16 peptidase-like protein n=1 Tax=Myxozyma melibiosi TaxID=54550 RepID=A0ABR1F781_9ASCO
MTSGRSNSLSLIADISPSYCPSRVRKWFSSRTGLQLVLVDQDRPIVEGYFAVATEIEDDSGCPHTLEHLIFMGSADHPYKGLLDTLGNRAFSSTNAWTATDSTVYTLSTAGWQGFRSLLPVYLDHLVRPTLSDAACYTEVYHVDGKGHEKGVVFSEMQGVENEASTIANLHAKKILYPDSSGYSSETGGLMGALRVLTNDRIRQFYEALYRPDNLCLIIVGSVDADELLETVAEFDATLPDLDPASKKPRPFVDSPPVPRLQQTTVKLVDFPDKDESSGHVLISFQGPPATDVLTNTALHVLLTYLTESDVSLLRKKLVEIEVPLATEIESYTEDFIDTELDLWLRNVPTSKLELVHATLFDVLREHADAARNEFDLGRMRDVIRREKLQFMLHSERYPSTLATLAITDFLYGDRETGKSLVNLVGDLDDYETVLGWEVSDWLDLMHKWLLDVPHVAILAQPSASLAKKIRLDGKERVRKTREELGEQGLEQLAKKLKSAQDENNRKIPDDLLEQFPAPDPAKVRFIKTATGRAGLALAEGQQQSGSEVQEILDKDGAREAPVYVHYEHIKSNFATLSVVLSTSVVPEDKLPLLNILLANFYATPIELDDGSVLDYEAVVTRLKRDTLSNSYSSGYDGEFDELLTLDFEFVPENYAKVVDWLRLLMWRSKFDVARLQIVVEKMAMGIPEMKRTGTTVVRSATRRLLFTPRSAARVLDELDFEDRLQEVSALLKSDPQAVVDELEQIRAALFTVENMRLIVCSDVTKLVDPVSSFTKILLKDKKSAAAASLVPITRTLENLTPEGASLGGKAYLLPVPSTESSYATVFANGPTAFDDADVHAIAVACSYLEAVEGPFWRGIRGDGLAYGAGMLRSIESGRIGFRVYRAADALVAIERAREIVGGYAAGKTEFEKLLVEGAVSMIVSAAAEADNNPVDAAERKYLQEVIKGLGSGANEKFLAGIREVTSEDLVRVMKRWFVPLFRTESASVFVACNPSKTEGLRGDFERLGYEVVVDPFDSLKRVGEEGSEEESEEGSGEGSEEEEDSSDEEESEESEDSDDDSD